MPFAGGLFRSFSLALLASCSPALNWREVVVPEMEIQALFPCKPQRHVQLEMGLVHCEAEGARFVLGWRPLGPLGPGVPAEQDALNLLAKRMNARVQPIDSASSVRPDMPLGAGFLLKSGDGSAAWVRIWVSGSSLNQAMVVGSQRPGHNEAAEAFLAALRKRT